MCKDNCVSIIVKEGSNTLIFMFSNIVPNVVLNLVLNSISFYIVRFCEVEVALQIATFWKLYHSTCCHKVLHLGCCSSPRSASALKNLWWSFFLSYQLSAVDYFLIFGIVLHAPQDFPADLSSCNFQYGLDHCYVQ